MEPTPLDQYENALIQYLKRTARQAAKLDDLKALMAWRCEIEPQYVDLIALAEWVYELVMWVKPPAVPFDLWVHASPSQAWKYGALETGPVPIKEADDNLVHYARLLAVLCSRLRLTEVAKLPGYDHNATVGPFGHLAN